MQEKRLEANTRLGDADGIAAASWDLARIDLAREDHQAAYPRLVEAFQIFRRLQRPDGLAVVGATLGGLQGAAGLTDQARETLTKSRAAATKIGQTDLVDQITALLKQLDEGKEQT